MARRRNEETIRAIKSASRMIILEHGFGAATYSELARRTGLPRTTIQHYVPQKEALATDFMQDIATLSLERAQSMVLDETHPIAMLYLAGQISHGVYYSVPGLRQLLLDVSTDRRLQNSVAPHYDIDQINLLGIDVSTIDATTRDDLSFALDGVYGVHFSCLTEGRVPDSAWLNRPVANAIARIIGLSDAERDEILEPYALEIDEYLAIGAEVSAHLF